MQANADPQLSRFPRTRCEEIALDRTAILLDIDGTILDIAATPESVVVPASLRNSLRELHRRTSGALALVSGRLIENLDGLFAPLRLPAIGGHGMEVRLTSDATVERTSPRSLAPSMKRRLAALATLDSGIIAEDKDASFALHYRLAPQQREPLDREVTAVVMGEPNADLEILRGKSVVEIKPVQYNKGSAVIALMQLPPFAGRVPIFVGDDATDQTVFEILPRIGGRGFSVGRNLPGTAGTFGTPGDVRAWIAQLCGCGNDPQ